MPKPKKTHLNKIKIFSLEDLKKLDFKKLDWNSFKTWLEKTDEILVDRRPKTETVECKEPEKSLRFSAIKWAQLIEKISFSKFIVCMEGICGEKNRENFCVKDLLSYWSDIDHLKLHFAAHFKGPPSDTKEQILTNVKSLLSMTSKALELNLVNCFCGFYTSLQKAYFVASSG